MPMHENPIHTPVSLADAGTVSDRFSALRRSSDCTSKAWR